MDTKHFIDSITSKSFWNNNRKRIVWSAFVPLIIGVLTNKSAIIMVAYMYIAFPILLFSKYASPLVYLKKGVCQIAHRIYSKKEFLKIISKLQNIFVLSIVASAILAFLYHPFARLNGWIPFCALHAYCLIKNEPLSVIREWLKRIKFVPMRMRRPFEDRYDGVGGGPKAAFWRWHNQ